MAAPLLLEAVAGKTERPAFASACVQLAESLGGNWPVQLQMRETISSIDFTRGPAVVVLSLMGDVARDEPFAQIEARWREILPRLMQSSEAQIFLCTVFRAVPDDEASRRVDGAPLVERIRRLNLMSAHLSHDFGANVIDIDRVFAFIGARAIGTDYRLLGDAAADTAGFTIAAALLDVGLDGAVPHDELDRARERHRNSDKIEKALGRRRG